MHLKSTQWWVKDTYPGGMKRIPGARRRLHKAAMFAEKDILPLRSRLQWATKDHRWPICSHITLCITISTYTTVFPLLSTLHLCWIHYGLTALRSVLLSVGDITVRAQKWNIYPLRLSVFFIVSRSQKKRLICKTLQLSKIIWSLMSLYTAVSAVWRMIASQRNWIAGETALSFLSEDQFWTNLPIRLRMCYRENAVYRGNRLLYNLTADIYNTEGLLWKNMF